MRGRLPAWRERNALLIEMLSEEGEDEEGEDDADEDDEEEDEDDEGGSSDADDQ